MATASIIISQPGNPQPVGLPGRARDDLLLGLPVLLSNASADGVAQYRWTLEAKPPGSTATISGPTSATAQFVPDKHGSYRVRLTLNSAGPSEVQTRIAAVRDGFGRRIPAVGETGPEGNYDVGGSENVGGWGPDVQALLASVVNYSFATTGGGTAGSDFEIGISASEEVTKVGLGLPEDASYIVGTDIVQVQGTGDYITLNDVSVVTIMPMGDYNIVGVVYDLYTTDSKPGDEFLLVSTSINPIGRFMVGLVKLV